MTSRPRIRGLDGLRALAVIGVVVYHVWPSVLPGGFIGVDVFFVLSGYLITRSFSARPGEGPAARLVRFWRHRARRILPPLLPVILITAASAGVIGRDVLPGLWAAVIGACTFSSNWVAIAQSTSYFTGTSAHPLQHLWSLAVEEQFYLLWPLLLLLLGLLAARVRAWIPVSAAIVSATAMAVLFVPGSDPTTVYVGTGTHLFGLALGAALALHQDRRTAPPPATPVRRRVAALVGIAALAVLIIAALELTDSSSATYRGGLAAVSVATAALIWSVSDGVPGIGRLLDVRPLRALGQRSYAVYLWHWPALILLTATITPRTAASHVAVWALTLLSTLVAATASWRWLEQPILRRGWRNVARRIRRTRPALRAAAALTVGTLTVGTGAACVASTRPPEAEQLIIAGQQYLHDHPATVGPSAPTTQPPQIAPSPPPASVGTEPPTDTPAPAAPTAAAPTAPASAAPTPTPDVTQTPITAVGDSVLLAAAPTLRVVLPNTTIDAEVSRQPAAVVSVLRADAAAGQLADTVLVDIGTNGALGATLPRIRAAIGPNRTLVLVTAHGDRAWIAGVNTTIRAFAATDPHTKVADWDHAITGDEDLLASDGIHSGTAGARIYAQAIVDALRS